MTTMLLAIKTCHIFFTMTLSSIGKFLYFSLLPKLPSTFICNKLQRRGSWSYTRQLA